MSGYKTFCNTNGLLISPVYDTSTDTDSILKGLMECTNSEYVNTQGKVKIIPYYDGLDPLYNITDDDILNQSDDSLTISSL